MGAIKDVWDIACDIGERVSRLFRKRQERSNVEKVLSVMAEGKTWRRTDLAKLANISDDAVLQVLSVLKNTDQVISIDVDEEPKGTFWRRI